MRAYRLALELVDASWTDVRALTRVPATRASADQLYRAIGSIAANLAEGYSRSSGRDRVRLFEYALGSARECIVWYRLAAPVLGHEAVAARTDRLSQIVRLLLAVIPLERDRTIGDPR